MTKHEITSLLSEKHKQFLASFPPLSEKEFTTSINGKWSPAQQLDHIIRSASPVVMAFGLPGFILKWKFGTANRSSKTYDALVEKYHTKLAAGGKASKQFIPTAVNFQEREAAIAKVDALIQKLNKRVENKSEATLDKLILPHPLLGKLTFREMLYFTAYHAEHHEKATKKNLMH
jgi:cobalamin biosynthesis protein CbiD